MIFRPYIDRDTFVERLSDVSPNPTDMERVLAFNRGPETVATR
jgi:hypothetical protein